MPNEKNHLYSVFDLQKDNRQKEVRGAQQQYSQFSAGKSSSINSANIQSNNIPLQKDNQVAIGIPYNDTNGISGFITVDVNFAEYGTQYSFYTFNGDATFAFSNLPTGRSIEFTLDITVDPTNTSPITILFPQVTNPPVLAGNPGDRDVLRFIGVNRTDPQGINSPVQTFTFLTGATTTLSGYSLIQKEGTGLTQRTTMNFIGDGVTVVDNPTQFRTDITIGEAPVVPLQNLGDLTGDPDPFVVDFNDFDTRQLFANLIGSATSTVTISFTNIPVTLSANLKIYMTPQNDNSSLTLTSPNGSSTNIFGTGNTAAVNDPFNIKPLATNDFLSIEFESTDQTNITVTSVKKNDEEEPADVVPAVPESVESTNEQKTTINIIWEPPLTGSLPILYDLKWSLSPAGNTTDGPTTIFGQLDNIDALVATATGLTVDTPFFFWLRGTNTAGDGLYFGPLQTVTEPSNTAGNVNFSISETSFDTVQAQWTQPTGKQLQFTLTRDPGGVNENLIISRNVPASGVTKIVTDGGINPLTTFLYRFQVFNEVGSLLSTIDTNVTTEDLPQPVLALSAVGRRLQFIIDFPAGINICRVEWDIANTFDERKADLQVVKTEAKGTAQQVTIRTQDLNQNTLFFVRAQFELNADDGQFNTIQQQITGILPTPGQPSVNFINLISGADTLIRFDVDFANAPSVNESAILSIRDKLVTTKYLDFGGNILSRDNPPSDDLDPNDEDEIQVVRGGGGWGAKGILTVDGGGGVTAIAITNGGAEYVNGSRIRIFDRDDFNFSGFTGTAIVSGGRLTGVNILTGGSAYDGGAEVLLPGLPVSGDSVFSLWVSGQDVNLRAVASNLTGTSTADSDNGQIE